MRKALEGGGAAGGTAAGAGAGVAGGLGGVKNALQAAEEKVVELEMKIRDLTRKLQDADGEAKRARMEMQEVKAKHGDVILKLKEQQAENDKLVTGLKMLSAQVIELEENGGGDEEMEADLAAAEELAEQLEEQVKTLKEQLASAGGPPDTKERDALRAQLESVRSELANKELAASAMEEDSAAKDEQLKELQALVEKANQGGGGGGDGAANDAVIAQLQEQIKKDALAQAEFEERVKELQQQLEAFKREESSKAAALNAQLESAQKREQEARAALEAAKQELEKAHQERTNVPAAAAGHSNEEELALLRAQVAERDALKLELEKALADRAAQGEMLQELTSLRAQVEAAKQVAAERDAHASDLLKLRESHAKVEEELRKAKEVTDQQIASLEQQLRDSAIGGGGGAAAVGGGGGGDTTELQNRIAELEGRTAYMDQLESELQAKKIQVLAMMENHEEVQKELVELREKAQRLDETTEKATKMEEFLMGLQDERNELAQKLETAEQQISSLGAMLGKAQNAGNAEEIQKALTAAQEQHAREVEALKLQVSKRDEELARVQGAMSTLRHAAEARMAAKEEHKEAEPAVAAVAEAKSVAEGEAGGAVAAAAASGAGAGGAAAGEGGSAWQVVHEGLGNTLVAMNTARMEAAKERQSFADKKAFKDPEAYAKGLGGRLVGVRHASSGAVAAVCAAVRSGTACELKYVALGEGGESALAELVRAAEQWAAEQSPPAEQLVTLYNGSMSDAEKKWGQHGFKLNGVGPPPEFMVKLSKALK